MIAARDYGGGVDPADGGVGRTTCCDTSLWEVKVGLLRPLGSRSNIRRLPVRMAARAGRRAVTIGCVLLEFVTNSGLVSLGIHRPSLDQDLKQSSLELFGCEVHASVSACSAANRAQLDR
jgi:hypothetical protein